jgi:hypothetical protein
MPSSQPRTTSSKSERKGEERGAAALALDLANLNDSNDPRLNPRGQPPPYL